MKYAPLLALLFATTAQAAMYSESVSGDLSGDGNAPTALSFTAGANVVSGVMGTDVGNGLPLDRDIFSFTVPSGYALTSIFFNRYDHFGQSFYAIAAGTSIDVTDSSQHLSNALIQHTGDYLPALADRPYSAALGLTNPVPAGTYTVWFQELSSLVPYETTYTLTAVPEPSAVSLLVGPALAVLRRRRK